MRSRTASGTWYSHSWPLGHPVTTAGISAPITVRVYGDNAKAALDLLEARLREAIDEVRELRNRFEGATNGGQ